MSKATTAERALNRKSGTMSRLIKTLFGFYPVLLPLVVAGVVLCAVINSIGATFLQSALQIIGESWQSGDWEAAQPKIAQLVTTLACIYGVGILSSLFWNRAMAIITQGSLEKLREKMFNRMQDLPIRYFDTHQRGDIMSHYTNDVDTLRQLVGQALPNLLTMFLQMAFTLVVMLWYSLDLTVVVLAVVFLMGWLVKVIGGRSARFFLRQQVTLAKEEGFAEEAMNGERVIKVFTHEAAEQEQFDRVNEELFEASKNANIYGNTLGPILFNLGNLAYVAGALGRTMSPIAGVVMVVSGIANVNPVDVIKRTAPGMITAILVLLFFF